MGILDRLVIGGGLALVASGFAYLFKDARETAKRKSTPPVFDDRLTVQDFKEIVNQIAQKTPRVIGASSDGLIVEVRVRSNSGLTQWRAEIDFNDYGRPTGNYWINSDNKQSPIPELIAKGIQGEIQQRLG